MPAISTAATGADKENYVHDISESIKQLRRRASNKCPGVSPAKSTADSTSLPTSMATAAPLPLQKRQLPNGTAVSPSRKRTRWESDAEELNPVKAPQRQAGDVAGLMHDEILEMMRSSQFRSMPSVLGAASASECNHHQAHATQQRNVLPSLKLTLNSDIGVQLDGTTDRVIPVVANQPWPWHDKFGCEENTNQYGLQPNPLKSPTIDPYQSPSTQVHYGLDPYPDPALQPGTRAQLQSQEAIKRSRRNSEQWYELAPQSYPPPQVQPMNGPSSQQPPAQHRTGNQDDNAHVPSTYPRFGVQSSQVSVGTGSARPQVEPVCEGDARTPLRPVLQHSVTRARGQTPEHIRQSSQPSMIQQQSVIPETVSYNGTASTKIVSHTTNEVFNTVSAINKRGNINENGFTSGLQQEQHSMGSAQSSENHQNNMPSRQEAAQRQQPRYQPPRSSPDDAAFVTQVMKVLDQQRQLPKLTFGKRQATRVYEVLSIAKTPDKSEALFLSKDDAAQYFQPNVFFPGIIVTMDEQPLSLQSPSEFLQEFYDDSATLFIQDPSVEDTAKKPAGPRKVTIKQVKQRFAQNAKAKKKHAPWNCLELATHVEDGLRPAWLSGEDCRLLTKLKHPSTENEKDKAGRRSYEPGWKEVEKWALLAQAGALTEPHQDSHGYNTYITVNHGIIGFGWLANPTAGERQGWRQNPLSFTGGNWRYVVLRPGHTVYFPSGTVHFVFRLPDMGDTLAFGGHVLRCSQIAGWIKILLEEQRTPNVTNEDLSESAPAYLDRVETFVKNALQNKRADIWGGKENIEEFLKLKAEFKKNEANR